MNLNSLSSYLITLLIAIGSVAISSASTGFESCPENASCLADSSGFGWLENDEDSNYLDSLPCESTKPEFSLRNNHLFGVQFSQVDTPPHSHSPIRAPPLSF